MSVELERVRQSDDRRKTIYWRVVVDGRGVGAVRQVEPQRWRVTMWPPHRQAYRLTESATSKSTAIAWAIERFRAVAAEERHACCHNPSPGPHSAHCQLAFAEGHEIEGDADA